MTFTKDYDFLPVSIRIQSQKWQFYFSKGSGTLYWMFTNSPGLTGWGRMPQPNLPFDLFTVLSKGALLPQVPTGGQRVLLERKNNLDWRRSLSSMSLLPRWEKDRSIKHAQRDKIKKNTKDYKMQKYVADCKLSVCPHSSHELFTARHTLHFHLAGDSFD